MHSRGTKNSCIALRGFELQVGRAQERLPVFLTWCLVPAAGKICSWFEGGRIGACYAGIQAAVIPFLL